MIIISSNWWQVRSEVSGDITGGLTWSWPNYITSATRLNSRFTLNIVTDFNLLRHQGTMMGGGASMELFRLTFDLISKYLNISVTFSTLIAWPGRCRLYFLSDIVSLSQIMVPWWSIAREIIVSKTLFLRKLFSNVCFWNWWLPLQLTFGLLSVRPFFTFMENSSF